MSPEWTVRNQRGEMEAPFGFEPEMEVVPPHDHQVSSGDHGAVDGWAGQPRTRERHNHAAGGMSTDISK